MTLKRQTLQNQKTERYNSIEGDLEHCNPIYGIAQLKIFQESQEQKPNIALKGETVEVVEEPTHTVSSKTSTIVRTCGLWLYNFQCLLLDANSCDKWTAVSDCHSSSHYGGKIMK